MTTAEKSRGAFALAPHVYACRARDQIVLLDLKRDRYIGIAASAIDGLCRDVQGLPPIGNGPSSGRHEATSIEAASMSAETFRDMQERGFLVDSKLLAAPRKYAEVDRPEIALIEGYADIRVRIGVSDILSAVAATLTAGALLRYRALDQIVERLRRRASGCRVRPFDIEHARRRMAAFNRVRPLLYGEQDACLFTALAAREFLGRAGIVPQLVFGVTTSPFKAHCWLQHGNVVVNDAPEYVREFAPILAV